MRSLCVPRLGISLQASLLQIVGYRSLAAEVEKLRREPYDCENSKHEVMLMKVHSSHQEFNLFNQDLSVVSPDSRSAEVPFKSTVHS